MRCLNKCLSYITELIAEDFTMNVDISEDLLREDAEKFCHEKTPLRFRLIEKPTQIHVVFKVIEIIIRNQMTKLFSIPRVLCNRGH